MTQAINPRSRRLASFFLVLLILQIAGAQPTAAQTGADVAASISGHRAVRTGQNITYTIIGTNVGDATATDVQFSGWVPDWFNFVSMSCGTGVVDQYGACTFGSLAPGGSVSMTITVQACCPEKHMFEQGFVAASNDTNMANDVARIKVNFTGPKR